MLRIWLSIIFASWAAITCAQQNVQSAPPFDATNQSPNNVSSVLTVDLDSLFSQSLFGMRVVEEYGNQREALAVENRRIADALREEELTLAGQRAEMAVEVFVAEAEAFDEKAQAIRRAQDTKERELEQLLDDGRDRFLEVTRPILADLMAERGAVALLDRRTLLLSFGSIDVTESAIERVNTTLGDGTGALHIHPTRK